MAHCVKGKNGNITNFAQIDKCEKASSFKDEKGSCYHFYKKLLEMAEDKEDLAELKKIKTRKTSFKGIDKYLGLV